MIHYVCKYTPIELFAGFDEQYQVLESMRKDYPDADRVGHANLCGFGKAVIQAVYEGTVTQIVLVNCCDVMRRVFDIIKKSGKCEFVYLLDLPHENKSCSRVFFQNQIECLKKSYQSFSGKAFDQKKFLAAFGKQESSSSEYVGIVGARVNEEMASFVREKLQMPVRNHTCTGNRLVCFPSVEEESLFADYSAALLSQIPCRRMDQNAGRKQLYNDPLLKALIFHTMKFCDFSFGEYQEVKEDFPVPSLRIETDYTVQSEGQLSTRLEAFRETLTGEWRKGPMDTLKNYVAGVDSGSTSTDVVIMDRQKAILATVILSTGKGAQASAEESLEQALKQAHLSRGEIGTIVTTGYGREHVLGGNETVTEITCHAKGAFFLNPRVRTVIDIGGQDSKVIRLDDHGNVVNFVMNDKCAAGTGRFMEMMAHTLGLQLDELGALGDEWQEEITISSMCTVFAESEVVSLIARNKRVGDIVHALDKAVASKTASLVNRLGLEGEYMITGGVARNLGVVHAIENKLGIRLFVSPMAQLCGAIGAALFALE